VVVALRRALDVLTRTSGVDPKRIAFVGHDFGAMYGALLSGTDSRPGAFVFMTPTVSLAEWFQLDTDRPPRDPAAYETSMSGFDIPAALGRATFGATLVQFADHDEYVPAAKARAFAAAIVRPDKTVKTYPADHALHIDAATDDRRVWLLAHLGVRNAY
jgi:dienelactone hydrolase